MDAAHRPQGPLLLDLPVAVLRQHVWPRLSSAAQGHFRLASRACLALAQQLTTEFSFGTHDEDTRQQVVWQLGRCLGRQEHIEVLEIPGPWDEHQVAQVLFFSGTACHRVREVHFLSSVRLSHFSGEAIASHCLDLRSVTITSADRGEGNGVDASFFAPLARLQHLTEVILDDTTVTLPMMDAFFALPTLHKLHLGCADQDDDGEEYEGDGEGTANGQWHDPSLLPALLSRAAAMTRLTDLSLTLPVLEDVAPLRHCAALCAMTQLTSLHLSSHRSYEDVDDNGVVEAFNALLARVGSALHGLVSLRLDGFSSDVDDVGLGGLRQLTRLTQLHISTIALAEPEEAMGDVEENGYKGLSKAPPLPDKPPPALLQLQELRLGVAMNGSDLLCALEPLLPERPHSLDYDDSLSETELRTLFPDHVFHFPWAPPPPPLLTHLRSLTAAVCFGVHHEPPLDEEGARRDAQTMTLPEGFTDRPDFLQRMTKIMQNRTEENALGCLRTAAAQLAAAPLLQHIQLTLYGSREGTDPKELRRAMKALKPLRSRLRQLELGSCSRLHLGALGAALAPFVWLTKLVLSGCEVDAGTMVDIGRNAGVVRRLEVEECDTGGVKAAMLAAMLVAVREAALEVQWDCLGEGDVQEVRAVVVALGKSHIISVNDA